MVISRLVDSNPAGLSRLVDWVKTFVFPCRQKQIVMIPSYFRWSEDPCCMGCQTTFPSPGESATLPEGLAASDSQQLHDVLSVLRPDDPRCVPPQSPHG